jgi:hypothetical protein
MKKVFPKIIVLVGMILSFPLNPTLPSNLPSSDDKILIDSGIDPWVPNPLVGEHKWKKFFSDEKFTPSKKAETLWYYDTKTEMKAKGEKLNLKGQPLSLEGATLVWVKSVDLKNHRTSYLFYGLWPEKKAALFFGIFEKDDRTKSIEEIGEMEEISKMAPGLERAVLENLINMVFKPWWKIL